MSKSAPDNPTEAGVLLNALIGLIPEIAERDALGFTAEAREDALMDSILRVLELEHSAVERSNPTLSERVASRYAFRVVKNQLIDRFRKERLVLKHGALEDVPNASAEFVQSSSGRRKSELVAAWVDALKLDDRDLLQTYFEDPELFKKTYNRIGLRPGTARVRVHRLIRRLRSLSAPERTGLPVRR